MREGCWSHTKHRRTRPRILALIALSFFISERSQEAEDIITSKARFSSVSYQVTITSNASLYSIALLARWPTALGIVPDLTISLPYIISP